MISHIIHFLDAPSHLYKRVCTTVRPSIRRSIRRSVTPSLRYLLGASYAEDSALFESKYVKDTLNRAAIDGKARLQAKIQIV